MLEDARGINCQAANFCKTISALPQGDSIKRCVILIELILVLAGQMGVIDYGRETADADYVSKIQTFNRFMLEQFISEGNTFPHNPRIVESASELNSSGDFITPAPAPITQLFGIDAKSIIICGSCGARRDKEGLAHVVEMLYPKKVYKGQSIYAY
jgi:PAB-dependent poly(A)-specific ribonuclease subunit 2